MNDGHLGCCIRFYHVVPYYCSKNFLISIFISLLVFLKYILKYLFIYLAVLGLSCGMQDLSMRQVGFSLVVAHGLSSCSTRDL